MMVKQYQSTLQSFTLLKTREAFATLIENGDLEKVLPLVLQTEESRSKFSSFIKISYNEAKKNSNVNSKKFLALIRNTLIAISKRGRDGDHMCSEFITKFFVEDILKAGFKSMSSSTTLEGGKKEPIIKNKFFRQEEEAVKYGSPALFTFLIKHFLKENKEAFRLNYAVLSDTLTLALSYSYQLGAFSTKLKQSFVQLALEIVYFANTQVKRLDIKSIENLVSNKLALHTCESLKNKKTNEKNTES